MEKSMWKRAVWEVLKASLAYLVFCLFAMAILAAFVKGLSPSQTAITISCWVIKAVGCFACALVFLRSPRALFKGIASGIVGAVLAMLLFAAIGGGFHVTVFFLLELIMCAVAGSLGALLGAKLRG